MKPSRKQRIVQRCSEEKNEAYRAKQVNNRKYRKRKLKAQKKGLASAVKAA